MGSVDSTTLWTGFKLCKFLEKNPSVANYRLLRINSLYVQDRCKQIYVHYAINFSQQICKVRTTISYILHVGTRIFERTNTLLKVTEPMSTEDEAQVHVAWPGSLSCPGWASWHP